MISVRRTNINLYKMPTITGLILCCALSGTVLSLQMPTQPGRLVIASAPAGATITLNDQTLDQKTNVTLVVPSGVYRVAVVGGAGNMNCSQNDVQVTTAR